MKLANNTKRTISKIIKFIFHLLVIINKSLKEWRLFLFQNSKLRFSAFSTFNFPFQNLLSICSNLTLTFLTYKHVLEKPIYCFLDLSCHVKENKNLVFKLFLFKNYSIESLPILYPTFSNSFSKNLRFIISFNPSSFPSF